MGSSAGRNGRRVVIQNNILTVSISDKGAFGERHGRGPEFGQSGLWLKIVFHGAKRTLAGGHPCPELTLQLIQRARH